MQNLKSLNNLIQKPVLGKNDDYRLRMPRPGHPQGFPKEDIYSYAEETKQMLMKIEEPQRKLLQKQLLTDFYQD